MDRSIAPEFKTINGIRLLEPVHEILENGIDLFTFNAGDQELVRIEWIFNHMYMEKPVGPLLNIALTGMLLEGTQQHSGAQIAEQVDFYGAFLQPEYSFDHSALTLYVLNKHVDKLLPLIKEILSESTFPQQELDTYIRNNKQHLAVSLNKNDFVARRTFNKAIFGDARYGYSPSMTDYDQLIQADLVSLYEKQINPANCTILVSGKVKTPTITAIRKLFGTDWKRGITVEQPVYFPQIEEYRDLIVVEKADALQSAIRLGYTSINRTHNDFPALQLVNTLLGGYFGSRLMSNIREDKGYTYSIGSGIASLKYGGFFTIATEVGVEVTDQTLIEIEKEINRLKTELVDENELNLVKNYMGGTFLGSLENVFSHVDKFKSVHFVGLNLDYYNRHLSIIQQSTAKSVLETAHKYLDFDRMVKVVVGKLDK